MATQARPSVIAVDQSQSGTRSPWVRMLPGLWAPSLISGRSPSPSSSLPRALLPRDGLSLRSALLASCIFLTICCESRGLSPSSFTGSSDSLPPVPTPACLSEHPPGFTSPRGVCSLLRVREGRSTVGVGRGGGFPRGVPQPSQKGQTAFWLPSVEPQSEGPGRLWVSKSHLWARRIIKTFSQTLEAAFQTAGCQSPS